jgi:transposase
MYLTLTAIWDLRQGRLQKALATRFGVNRRFIAVRMERYGLLSPEAKPR